MQDEHWALQDSAARVQDMVLEGSNKISSLAASLSSAVDLIEGRVDAVVTNGVHWGAWLALTTALSHFPKLEHEFDLLAFKYNADLTEGRGQLVALSTRTCQALKTLLSRVPLSVSHSPPDGTGGE
jgi:hypothetical protein